MEERAHFFEKKRGKKLLLRWAEGPKVPTMRSVAGNAQEGTGGETGTV
jgi:hypothetical protein